MKTLLISLTLLIITGCATPKQYINDSATPEQVNQDNAFCQLEAMQAGSDDAYGLCMKAKGYVEKSIK